MLPLGATAITMRRSQFFREALRVLVAASGGGVVAALGEALVEVWPYGDAFTLMAGGMSGPRDRPGS
ncbi:hypothetical protein [Streptomyces tanashiensis]|uniref:Uncharacterized protein n=1 Tax=Streptomyces tanashiensis TaxID=67367 RepID=A0ABY6R8B8_9ACTN|nr:hypothetical protein [Streptomyces tanashiensis]UZX26318.1 hypothetical protein LDH80_39295 [Streptomyces tanashiensis]